MSAPADLEVAQKFWRQLVDWTDTLNDFSSRELSNFVYLFGAIVTGGWSDFDLEEDKSTVEFLKQLPCYQLLELYLTSTQFTAEDLQAAKTAYAICPQPESPS